MALEIKIERAGQNARIRLKGQLDTDTAPEFRPTLDEMRESTPAAVVVEMSGLDYLSSAGLRCLFQLRKIVKGKGGRMLISKPSPQVRKVLEIVKAVPIDSIFSSDEEMDAYLDRVQRGVDPGQ